MVENLGRYLTSISVFVIIAIAALLVPESTFVLGLDLQGGTRYVLDIPIEEARERGDIGPDETDQEVIEQTMAIFLNRADPDGVKEPVIRREGISRVVVELPGVTNTEEAADPTALVDGVDAAATTLVVDPETAANLPFGGGKIQIGDEMLRYTERTGARGNELLGVERGQERMTPTPHAAGASVRLVSTDAILNAIQSVGNLFFAIQAEPGDTYLSQVDPPTTYQTERDKLDNWLTDNPGGSFADFNLVPFAEGGPHPAMQWLPRVRRPDEEAANIVLTPQQAAVGLLRTENIPAFADKDWDFTGEKLKNAYRTPNPNQLIRGGPFIVGFEWPEIYAGAFLDFTKTFKDRTLCTVLNGNVEIQANIESAIYDTGTISGDYTIEEVDGLVTVLRSGSLKLKPELIAEERVGPSLGAGYVRRGAISGGVALIGILAFMSWYYRRLGCYAVVSLLANMLFLAGGLALLRPAVTLPGIAGIILTIGMAVDANILIFDRIREERDAGRNIKQAAKEGFDRAFSAIVDANVTTFLTAVILKSVATGPVRGFANTLSIGVITSVFSALVVTRVLVHKSLEKDGESEFKVGTWMVKAAYDWMGKRKAALTGSLIAIAAAVTAFTVMPRDTKFGIDFLGGATVQIRTDQPQTAETIRDALGNLSGSASEATVKPVVATAEGDGYREFRLTFKVDSAQETASDELDFKSEVRNGLSGLLQKGPIEITSGAGQEKTVRLYFGEEHPIQDISSRLEGVGLNGATVSEAPEGNAIYVATGMLSGGIDFDELALSKALLSGPDSNGLGFTLPEAITDSSTVGAQVVGDLRDSAILAMIIALGVIIMYLRVRFADYSYGFAAVAALVHDVLITLGILVVANATGIVRAEIDLPMIAAFLTIIGYSLNDTIVVFDRVRENLTRVEGSLSEVLNRSINQTLSRTILTSATTLLAVLVLFVFNYGTGNTLEGFSFAMVIGVLVGTYSSIFIASPMLLFFHDLQERKRAKAHAAGQPTAAASA
ncbi:MAG: protein translocase subunit SecD [Planctomycetota bacterium]|jgi:protein-export membrane protein SecD/preprotein translocase SecF subunit